MIEKTGVESSWIDVTVPLKSMDAEAFAAKGID